MCTMSYVFMCLLVLCVRRVVDGGTAISRLEVTKVLITSNASKAAQRTFNEYMYTGNICHYGGEYL